MCSGLFLTSHHEVMHVERAGFVVQCSVFIATILSNVHLSCLSHICLSSMSFICHILSTVYYLSLMHHLSYIVYNFIYHDHLSIIYKSIHYLSSSSIFCLSSVCIIYLISIVIYVPIYIFCRPLFCSLEHRDLFHIYLIYSIST